MASAASLELDEVVAFVGREEVVGVNRVELGVHAVHAPDALDEPGWIPRDVVVDDDVRAMKVHAFGENFGGHEDAVIVLGPIRLGVEVGDDVLADALKRFAGEEQDFRVRLRRGSFRRDSRRFPSIR